ncbi:MAG TPA: pyridoxal phosphate-dependent aminotransferase [Candidatus Binatia bacterium]|jgi:aspartate aminotransferase|nr:pyridoxal phosphate-dependent aminotransferase [Candidatus Binatia bacterium]
MSLHLASRVRTLKPSPTLAMSAEAAAMRAAGTDVVDLSAGEPDFDTPEHVKAATREALARGQTKYTPVGGTNELKDAIRAKIQRDSGLTYDRTEVMASCGGKHALYNAFQALFEGGDEILLPSPYWVSYPEMLELAGATPRILPTTPASGFRITAEELDAACGPRTVGFILNSPSNPTGAVYSSDQLRALGEVCVRRNLIVFSDDIYEHIADHHIEHIGALVPELRPRLVILNAVSKTYAMTGWRIGFTAAPVELIKAMTALQSQSTSNPTSIAQAGAVAALNGPLDGVHAMAREFLARRDMVVEQLRSIPGVETTLPEGAFYVFPDFGSYFGRQGPDGPITSAQDLGGYFLRHASVATVPGEGFGAPRHIRLSYAAKRDVLEEGVKRIREALERLR